MNRASLRRLVTWFDQYMLLILCGFLLAFIPLYPKIPLFDIIPGYIVRARLEDLLIFLTAGIWLVQLKRKKVSAKTPLTPLIIAYAIAGMLSVVSAVVITRTVPFEPIHLGKTLLHFLRYMEYFLLFFIGFSATKSKRDLKILLSVFAATLLGVFIYGVGQKYFYWPVYSTMNREFSKGIRLVLTEHARVQSTFAGHYDLAAYLVVTLPLLAAWAFFTAKKLVKIVLWIIFITGLWLLMMTASRSSLLGYSAAMAVLLVIVAALQSGWRRKLKWFVTRSIWIGLITWIMLASYGSSMYERLLQSLEAFPAANRAYHGLNAQRKTLLFETIPQALGLAELPKLDFQVDRPQNSVSMDELDGVLVTSDERPIPARPSDVKVDVPDIKKVATVSADGTVSIISIEVPRTFSDTALQHGLSVAIRYDTLWPRAMQGFYTNPVFGTGYATLTKDTTYHFTEAESTDNNYLRILGETGLAGFLTFFGVIALALWHSVKTLLKNRGGHNRELSSFLAVGFIAGTIGLLVNAIYIDVFAASKVAQLYWALTGIVLAAYGFLLSEDAARPALQPTNKRPAQFKKRRVKKRGRNGS